MNPTPVQSEPTLGGISLHLSVREATELIRILNRYQQDHPKGESAPAAMSFSQSVRAKLSDVPRESLLRHEEGVIAHEFVAN